IVGSVKHFVYDIVARRHQADRCHPDDDPEPQAVRNVARAVAERGDDSWQHEDLLDPVVDPHDGNVTLQRGPRHGRGRLGGLRHFVGLNECRGAHVGSTVSLRDSKLSTPNADITSRAGRIGTEYRPRARSSASEMLKYRTGKNSSQD